jgi:hypothetical protein
MQTTTTKKPRAPRIVQRECCTCDECTSGARNNYFTGKRLTADTFRVEQRYLLDRRHLLNRTIHGWGVVYGYPVAMAAVDQHCPGAEKGQLEIGEGLALDRIGRELVQTGPVILTFENVLLLDDKGALVRTERCDKSGRKPPELDPGTCWLLRVHYAEQNVGPVSLYDPCSCERNEWDRVCETVRFSIQRIDCGDCCADEDCELHCYCSSGPCCEEHEEPKGTPKEREEQLRIKYEKLREEAGGDNARLAELRAQYERELKAIQQEPQAARPKVHGRGGCRCLCEHLTGLQLGANCTGLCKVDDCARADLNNGIALACLKLEHDECGMWRFASVYDACGPRRLVKRNDLLFDLIRGCDVTRISETGWANWHRSDTPVPFDDFAKALGYSGAGGEQDQYVATSFWVRFSGPVHADTVKADCFAMTIMGTESEGGWWNVFRVPIIGVDFGSFAPEPGDPAGTVRGACIVVEGGWLEDAVEGRHSIFRDGQARVEFEVRGDFIVDCNGQTVDANARGLTPFPSGSDGPGDSYLSTFAVARRTANPIPVKRKSQAEGVQS